MSGTYKGKKKNKASKRDNGDNNDRKTKDKQNTKKGGCCSCKCFMFIFLATSVSVAAVIYQNPEIQQNIDTFLRQYVGDETLDQILEAYKIYSKIAKQKLDEGTKLISEWIDVNVRTKREAEEQESHKNEIKEKERQKQQELEAERKAKEEQARLEAERKAKEEQARLEAERKAKEEQARLEAERKAKEEQARLEAERKAKEEQARLEAERKAKEEQARLEAERKAKEEQARLEAERKVKEEQARLEAERKAKEEQARLEAERKAKEEQARLEAERKAKEEQARLEAEKKAKEEQARLEAERKAKEEQARLEAERKAKEEQARFEAERKAKEEQARVEAERKAKEEQARVEAERKAKEEQARLEAERKAKEEQARLEAERKAKEEQARVEAERKAKEEQARLEAERKAKEEQARVEAEKKAKEEQARLEAERKAKEEQARVEAEKKAKEEKTRGEAERKAKEEQARLEAEKKAKEEQARLEAERKAKEEQARVEAERKAKEEQARLEAERKAKEEQARLEAERKAKEEQARVEAERKAKEEQARLEAERKAKEEADKKEKLQAEKEVKKQQDKTKKPEQDEKTKYSKLSITNEADYIIRDILDSADTLLEKKKYEDALKAYEQILSKNPRSPRASYGKGLAIDALAEQKRSNDLLGDAIGVLQEVMELKSIPDDLLIQAGKKLTDRQQFRGWGKKAANTMETLAKRFPQDLDIKNQLGVQYLMIGENEKAKQTFKEVLDFDKTNGHAKVHLGFIYKTSDNDPLKAIPFLKEGIESREPGTEDGRFYFHLGDAYQRTDQKSLAYEVYEEGAKKGLFLSKYQRSLYNVDSLTGRPWWTPEQTGQQELFKTLEKNWQMIRDEGLKQLNKETGSFMPEEENLIEKGDWKQFTLYTRGKKNKKNCDKVPKVCELIDKFPDVKGCTRGQVKYSVMEPGIHVWPHCGPTNCRIRAHLGLVIPPGPKIRVANEVREWKEGKFIIFDDSFEHEVWHEGKATRLVLIVDIWHPELTEQQKRTLSPI